MKSTVIVIGALAALAAGLSVPFGAASAHHSFAMFDQTKRITIEGTVKEYTWSNPHIWLDVMVPNAESSELEQWGIESQSAAILFRRGWRPDSIPVGESVTVDIYPMKDGTPGGQMLRVTLSDGVEFLTNQGERELY